MQRLRRALRFLGSLAATLVAGGLLGYVVMALLSPLLPGPVQPGGRHEFPYTRDYVVAILERDAATANALQVSQNPASRAMTYQRFEEALTLEPRTLTYLGGASVGPLGAYSYVLGVEAPGNTLHLVPFEITTVDAKVADVRGGSTGPGLDGG